MKFEMTGKEVHYSTLANEVKETQCSDANQYFVEFISSGRSFKNWLEDQSDEVIKWAEKNGYIKIIPEYDWSNLKLVDALEGAKILMLNGWELIHFYSDGRNPWICTTADSAGVGKYNERGQLILDYDRK